MSTFTMSLGWSSLLFFSCRIKSWNSRCKCHGDHLVKPINSLTQQSVRCTIVSHIYFCKIQGKKVCLSWQTKVQVSAWITAVDICPVKLDQFNTLSSTVFFLLLFCYISLNQFTQSVLNPSSIESQCGCHTEQGDVPRTHTKLFLVFFWKDTRRFISFCCGLGETHSYIFFCVNLPEGSVWTLGHWLPWQPHPPVSYNHRA